MLRAAEGAARVALRPVLRGGLRRLRRALAVAAQLLPTVFGLGLGTAALLTALFIFPASLLRPLGGWLSDRFGARPVTYVVFAAMLLACVPLAAAQRHARLRIGLAAFFACSRCSPSAWASARPRSTSTSPSTSRATWARSAAWSARWARSAASCCRWASATSSKRDRPPESCFWVMLALVAWSFAWLHLVVTGLKRRDPLPDLPAPAVSPTV